MNYDREPRRIAYDGTRPGWAVVRSVVGKLLAFSAALIVLAGAVALSLLVFAVIAAGMLLGGAYVWWKTRELRKQMRAAMSDSMSNSSVIEGEIIEGEVVRDE